MAYDPVKAHEYYEKYKKKGLKKGRKKGSGKKSTGKKKAKSVSLLGVSAAGLNDEGRMQAALVREQYKSQMNAALAGAKTEEERQQVRLEYSRKAQQAINDLKGSAEYAKPKASKSGSSGKSEEQKAAETEEKARAKEEKAKAKAAEAAKKKQIKTLNSQVTELKKILKMKDLTPESRAEFTQTLDKILKKLLKLKGVNTK